MHCPVQEPNRKVDNLTIANLCSYSQSCTAANWDISVKCLSQRHNRVLCPVWESTSSLVRFVRALKSNRKVAGSFNARTGHFVYLEKTLNAMIPKSGGVAHWEMHRCVHGKITLHLYSHNQAKQSIRRGGPV